MREPCKSDRILLVQYNTSRKYSTVQWAPSILCLLITCHIWIWETSHWHYVYRHLRAMQWLLTFSQTWHISADAHVLVFCCHHFTFVHPLNDACAKIYRSCCYCLCCRCGCLFSIIICDVLLHAIVCSSHKIWIHSTHLHSHQYTLYVCIFILHICNMKLVRFECKCASHIPTFGAFFLTTGCAQYSYLKCITSIVVYVGVFLFVWLSCLVFFLFVFPFHIFQPIRIFYTKT